MEGYPHVTPWCDVGSLKPWAAQSNICELGHKQQHNLGLLGHLYFLQRTCLTRTWGVLQLPSRGQEQQPGHYQTLVINQTASSCKEILAFLSYSPNIRLSILPILQGQTVQVNCNKWVLESNRHVSRFIGRKASLAKMPASSDLQIDQQRRASFTRPPVASNTILHHHRELAQENEGGLSLKVL